MPETTHVLNARLVNEGSITDGHLVIREGRIASISSVTPTTKADHIIDAEGNWVLPGLIDDQVHFREPGFPKKGTIETESMAAVAGGVTTYFEMPNTYPPTLDQSRLEEKWAIASRVSRANYGFFLGASNDNLEAIKRVDVARVPGIKVFMGSSTGNMRVDDPDILEQIFKHSPLVVLTHCEDDDMIEENLQRYKAVWGEDIPARYHPEIRSREACLKSSSLAVELANRYDANLHVLHITTAEELSLFKPGPIDGKRITAEACVHHMHYNDQEYAHLGHKMKCNPAIKKESDRLAIIEAVNDGRIDIIATDHAPHELEHKANPYVEAPSGLPLVQHSLVLLLERVRNGELTIEKVVERACHAPAKRFQVNERGYIREGYHADLVVCGLNSEPHLADADTLYSRCGWSTFAHDSFHGRTLHTLVNGQHVVEHGQILGLPAGQQAAFSR
jgi:dihydroorotase